MKAPRTGATAVLADWCLENGGKKEARRVRKELPRGKEGVSHIAALTAHRNSEVQALALEAWRECTNPVWMISAVTGEPHRQFHTDAVPQEAVLQFSWSVLQTLFRMTPTIQGLQALGGGPVPNWNMEALQAVTMTLENAGRSAHPRISDCTIIPSDARVASAVHTLKRWSDMLDGTAKLAYPWRTSMFVDRAILAFAWARLADELENPNERVVYETILRAYEQHKRAMEPLVVATLLGHIPHPRISRLRST